ncbi:hypothetical protein [Haloarcula laminariae]|uniref:hypothetical protein n=1 Tax=Haloarcula laminariae TaxID=2961577 RepID=UPI0024061A8A|nr:hypothetical protein [Halomicroarcula sp. FL173]
MPEITVSDSQRERLATIQDELSAAYIDTYGHIRTTDVVQYLLDTYTPPEQRGDVSHERIATAEFQDLQAVATGVEGVPGSGIDAETMRGKLLSTLGVEEFAARLAAVDGADTESNAGGSEASAGDDEVDDAQSGAADGDTEAEQSGTADGEGDDAAEDTDGPSADDAAGDDETASDESGSGPTPSTDGPGAILSAANQLLTDHDDKWREGGGDEPYEVDLPDGTTETVRTKDDVRGLLFKHY